MTTSDPDDGSLLDRRLPPPRRLVSPSRPGPRPDSPGVDSPGVDSSAAAGLLIEPLSNDLSLIELRRIFRDARAALPLGGRLGLRAVDPELPCRLDPRPRPGETFEFRGRRCRHRSLRQLHELFQLHGFRMQPSDPLPEDPELRLFVGVLDEDPERPADHRAGSRTLGAGARADSGAEGEAARRCERDYGPDSVWRRLDRLEEPEMLDDLLYAAARMTLEPGARVLSLGCNDGRELEIFAAVGRTGLAFTGLDLSEGAIARARQRFPEEAHDFRVVDLAELAKQRLEPFDAVLILNTLQCTAVDRDSLLRDLSPLLAPRCAVLISIPNSHFGQHDLLRRPLSRRDPRHDRSAVARDLRYLSRWLFRAGFRVVESFGTRDALLLGLR